MIQFPTSIKEAQAARARLRAGGVDEHDLRRRGIVGGPIADLRDMPGLRAIEATRWGGLRIGAKVTVAEVAASERIRDGWPALAHAAEAVGTPQIRAQGTVAGNLLQEVRCPYFRSADFDCLKKGGATCFAREGDHAFLSAWDESACVAPHPSTLAGALWAFDAEVEINGRNSDRRPLPQVLGDGTDPRRTHALEAGEVVTAIVLPPGTTGDRSAYVRTSHRARAEWALVEATARVRLNRAGKIEELSLVVGAVAPRPRRLDDVARALVGLAPQDPRIDGVLAALGIPAESLPQTGYKARLIPPTLRSALDRAFASEPVFHLRLTPPSEDSEDTP